MQLFHIFCILGHEPPSSCIRKLRKLGIDPFNPPQGVFRKNKSARIQMARERLGAVNNPVTNVINSLRKQKQENGKSIKKFLVLLMIH